MLLERHEHHSPSTEYVRGEVLTTMSIDTNVSKKTAAPNFSIENGNSRFLQTGCTASYLR
jgi:hypothetical protein